MGIARPVMTHFPYAWVFFVAFILVATFTMLNLFIAIIVNAMQRYSDAEHRTAAGHGTRPADDVDVNGELRALRGELERLRLALAVDRAGEGASR